MAIGRPQGGAMGPTNSPSGTADAGGSANKQARNQVDLDAEWERAATDQAAVTAPCRPALV